MSLGAGTKIMNVLLRSAVFAAALTALPMHVALAQPEGSSVPPAAEATAAPDAAPAEAATPVVRQSTPIPNDPEPPKRPSSRQVASPDEIAAAMKPLAHRCFVRDVMSFFDRTHVRCYNRAQGKLSYFAVDTSQPVAETLLNKAWKSMRSGKPLTVKYAPTSDLNPTNCAARDCRRLLDVAN
jgi:hypothetical protein